MISRYINATFLYGTLRACAIMSTAEYCRENEKVLITDKIGKSLCNGASSVMLWPICMYADMRRLEVFLRKKDPVKYDAHMFLFFE